MSTRELEDRTLTQVQLMTAAGWRLYRREPGGAVFSSAPGGSGISGGVHMILLVITFGLWLPVMILVELASMGRVKFCRLTFDDQGEPRYAAIKRPR